MTLVLADDSLAPLLELQLRQAETEDDDCHHDCDEHLLQVTMRQQARRRGENVSVQNTRHQSPRHQRTAHTISREYQFRGKMSP